MSTESNPFSQPDPVDPTRATRPLEPGEAETGAKQLEALNWAKANAPDDPGSQQILASQYLYKHYGILPNNGQGDWQHGSGGGAYGWKLVNGDLVPADRSWLERNGMLALTLGVLSAGTLSAAGVLGGGAATSTIGPSTGANMAATSAAASSVPSGIAATGDGVAATAGTTAATGGIGKKISDFVSSPGGGAITSAGLGALEQALAPRPHSFADGSASDPRNILKAGVGATSDLLGNLTSQLKSGVTLPSSFAQSPPNFSGPSLPMAFGVSGKDPALANPGLLHLGFNDPSRPAQAAQAVGSTSPGGGNLAAPPNPSTQGPSDPHAQATAAFRMLGVNV